MRGKKERVEVAYDEIKQEVRQKLIENYGNIAKFAYSDLGLELAKELRIKPEYTKMYLTPKGPKSFNVMEYLYKKLKLGNLEKNVTVVKTTTYFKV